MAGRQPRAGAIGSDGAPGVRRARFRDPRGRLRAFPRLGALHPTRAARSPRPPSAHRGAPPPPQRYGKVFIGPVESTRGLSFDTVFVPGLAERMFPRKITEEPILLDAVREQIGGGLATNPTRLDSERLALALAVGVAENRICFSYPRLDLQDQPRPRVPSFYAL